MVRDKSIGGDMKVCDSGDLAAYICAVADFPRPGILFRDISPLLSDAGAFLRAVELLADCAPSPPPDVVVGIEARGFIFAAAVAQKIGLPFVPVRKPGKLPRATLSASYQLEYGEDSLHVHADAVAEGARVFIIDDLIATGGTLCAAAEMMETMGATVAQTACLIELCDLSGRARYGRPLQTILQY